MPVGERVSGLCEDDVLMSAVERVLTTAEALRRANSDHGQAVRDFYDTREQYRGVLPDLSPEDWDAYNTVVAQLNNGYDDRDRVVRD